MDSGFIELDFISDLQSLADENVDQLMILKSFAKLLFCMMQQMSQLPFLLKNIQQEISKNINYQLHKLNNDVKTMNKTIIQNQIKIDSIQLHTTLNSKELKNINNKMKTINETVEQNQNKLDEIQSDTTKNSKKLQNLNNKIKTLNEMIDLNHKFPLISEKPTDFESDIFQACREGKLTSIRWLLEKENYDKRILSDNTYNNRSCNTPLHVAASFGHLPIVEYLIRIQNVDKDIRGYHEWTPLHCACCNNHLLIAEYLISIGAKINAMNNIGWTSLHYASVNGYTEVVKYLLTNGADKNIKNIQGATPYKVTSYKSVREILQ